MSTGKPMNLEKSNGMAGPRHLKIYILFLNLKPCFSSCVPFFSLVLGTFVCLLLFGLYRFIRVVHF